MKGKILIIDDEPEILDILETTLTTEGFQVRKASGGREALALCRSESFDLAITDIRMPEMDGFEVIKHVKALVRDIEIIVLTGFASIDNAIEALHAHGAFDFLRKPLEDMDMFFHTIHQALETRRLRVQNRALLEKLTEHRDHLEDMVARRTADLQQEINERKRLEAQLVQSQKMEAVGQLAGGIAHDFNTLLGIILGYGDMMRDNLVDESVLRENLEEIIKAGQRAKILVRQLLDFARPNPGDRRPIQLAPLVEDTLRLLRASLRSTIIIRQHIETASRLVPANSSQIEQVIMNLGMNAGDAIGEQGGAIDISLTDVEIDEDLAGTQAVQPGPYVQLCISDTGCGMRPDTLDHIFEPFFTTKEVGKGSGLGLAVVHGIVTSHEGFITVESTPGKGTRFHVYLPTTDE